MLPAVAGLQVWNPLWENAVFCAQRGILPVRRLPRQAPAARMSYPCWQELFAAVSNKSTTQMMKAIQEMLLIPMEAKRARVV